MADQGADPGRADLPAMSAAAQIEFDAGPGGQIGNLGRMHGGYAATGERLP